MAYKPLVIKKEMDIMGSDILWAADELSKARNRLKYAKVTFSIENHKITTLKTESTKKAPLS